MTGHGKANAAWARRIVGAVLVVLGLYALFGGLFLPPGEVLASPVVIPLPEALIPAMAMSLGAALALWPAGKS